MKALKLGDEREGRRLIYEAARLAEEGNKHGLLQEALRYLVEIDTPEGDATPGPEFADLVQRYASACDRHFGHDSIEALNAYCQLCKYQAFCYIP